jgi:hypothetical protein
MYSPILRNRQSELLALRRLGRGVRAHIKPIVDIAAPSKGQDVATGLAYVERNLKRTEKAAAGFAAIFVDSSELDPAFRLSGNVHPLVGGSMSVMNAGAIPIPVSGLHRDQAHHQAALLVANGIGEGCVCLRLDATDVSTASLTAKRIKSLLSDLKVVPARIYLLLDLQCLFGEDPAPIAKQVSRFLKLVADEPWSGILVGGYGVPDQLSTAVPTKAQGYLPRVEQQVFYALEELNTESPVWFSDYTVLPPSVVELDWKLIRKVMCPKALYTLTDSWFVVRGGAFSSHPDEYEQYFKIAAEIVVLEEFSGPEFSYGDDYIFQRSEQVGSPGNPGSWISVCVNHHLTFTSAAHAK